MPSELNEHQMTDDQDSGAVIRLMSREKNCRGVFKIEFWPDRIPKGSEEFWRNRVLEHHDKSGVPVIIHKGVSG